MWKKILPLTFFGSFIAVTCSNVVSCNIVKQKQLSFNLNDWKDSWAFTTQSIWQALGKAKKGVLLEESKGLFLKVITSEEKIESFESDQLFKIFDDNDLKKSSKKYLETYLQLQYFVPSIIYYNEKKYDSSLKDWKSITKNFEFKYQSSSPTEVDEELDKQNGMPADQSGPVVELVWNTNQAGETLSSYFDLTIKLRNPELIDEQWVSEDGYYINTGNDDDSKIEITWKMGVYFFLPVI